jgi:hypothetical protein
VPFQTRLLYNSNMEDVRRPWLTRTRLLHLATLCAVVLWAARDLFDWAFCLAGLAVFCGCVWAVRTSAIAAQAELADDSFDAEDADWPEVQVG